jgi:hypothetical protein
MTRGGPHPSQADAALRGLLGCLLLCFPKRVGEAVDPAATTGATVGLTRLLGARHLAEATVLWCHPSSRLLKGLVAVDLIHASSMAAISVGSARYRQLARAAAFLAAAMVGVSVAAEIATRREA